MKSTILMKLRPTDPLQILASVINFNSVLFHVVADLFMLYYKRLTLWSCKLICNQYWFVVKAIKFIKIKTRFYLEHVINGSLR